MKRFTEIKDKAATRALTLAFALASIASPLSFTFKVSAEEAVVTPSTPPAATSADSAQTGKAGFKGRPNTGKSAKDAANSSLAALTGGPYYFYAARSQAATTTGAYANVYIGKPYLNSNEYHSVSEISVEKTVGGTKQIVEVGWNVDTTVNGDSNPHLFVYHWVNGAGTCYNGCGFVDYAPNATNAGATLTQGSAKSFGIQYDATTPTGGGWWVSYNGNWVGYFPSSLWTSATPSVTTYTNSDYVQFFGEVASSVTTPCSDMGTGTAGSTGALPAAYFGSITYLNGPAYALNTTTTNSSWYSVGLAGTRTFYQGGAGNGGVINGC